MICWEPARDQDILTEGTRGGGLTAGWPGVAVFPPLERRYPACRVHGAMNAVGGDVWRCLAFGCNVGMRWPLRAPRTQGLTAQRTEDGLRAEAAALAERVTEDMRKLFANPRDPLDTVADTVFRLTGKACATTWSEDGTAIEILILDDEVVS